jgi:hypothetical protein
MRGRIQVVALLAVVGLAGCGGSGKSKPPIDKRGSFSTKPGLLGSATSAGTIPSYVPTGKIIADDGFRPALNGFAFENYGNDAGPINLEPINVEHLFGPQVCAYGSGASCILTPSARAWMQQENAAMANGHCMGFSVTALRFFSGDIKDQTFGGNSTPTLPIRGNIPLQQLIAEDWAYQSLPAVEQAAIQGSPSHVLQALVRALNANKETYTLGILKADGTGGHAITPFAVEDKGGGKMEILVYDNNFPGVVRKVDVDTTADTWHYVGGINPTDTSEIYDGNAQTRSMVLFPTSPGEGTQPCPFCSSRPGTNPNPGSFLPQKKSFIEVALLGQPGEREHPHLLFGDPATGQKTGYVNGRLVEQIPDIIVNHNFALQDWKSSSEPTYDLQLGHPDYQVIIDGRDLTHSVVMRLTINGGGILFAVNGINMVPGQVDIMGLPKGDFGVQYDSTAPFNFTPTLSAFFVAYSTNKAESRFVEVIASRVGYKPGAPFTLAILPQVNRVLIGSADGATPVSPHPSHYLWLATAPLRAGPPAVTFHTTDFQMSPSTQVAQFPYLDQYGATLPVYVTDKVTDKLVRTANVPRSKSIL